MSIVYSNFTTTAQERLYFSIKIKYDTVINIFRR